MKLAECQLRGEQNEAAIASAQRAPELGWTDPSLVTLTARAQLGAKRYDDAIKRISKPSRQSKLVRTPTTTSPAPTR